MVVATIVVATMITTEGQDPDNVLCTTISVDRNLAEVCVYLSPFTIYGFILQAAVNKIETRFASNTQRLSLNSYLYPNGLHVFVQRVVYICVPGKGFHIYSATDFTLSREWYTYECVPGTGMQYMPGMPLERTRYLVQGKYISHLRQMICVIQLMFPGGSRLICMISS